MGVKKIFSKGKKFLSIFVVICLFSISLPFIQSYAATEVETQLVSGCHHFLMLEKDGTVKSWGSNSTGQLGLGDEVDRYVPTAIPNLTGVKQISTNGYFGLALLNDGTVKAWGQNQYGQLGLGDTTFRNTPQLIPGLSGVKQVIAGLYFSFVIMENGSVMAWGYNGNGELGIENRTSKYTPQLVDGLTDVKQLVAGRSYSFAIMQDGTVKAWGSNSYGQLGLGHTNGVTTPTLVNGLSSVKQITAGKGYHTLALKSDGTVYAWGLNTDGQLGLGYYTNQSSPVQVPLTDVSQVEAGEYFSGAVLNDGTVKFWGSNLYAQFGTGNTTNSKVPVSSTNFSGVKSLKAGAMSTIAVMNDGSLKACGYNRLGVLGIGDNAGRSVPVSVPMINMFDIAGLQAVGSPNLEIKPTLEKAIINNPETPLVTSILAGDAQNKSVTCKVFIDTDISPKSTKVISTNTSMTQRIIFDPIDVSGLTEGNHIIKFEASNGSNTVTKTATVYINKNSPIVDSFTATSTDNYIKVAGKATDISGLNERAYRYSVNGTYTGDWLLGSSSFKYSVSGNYNTEGNGGRKMVRLDNGCLVAGVYDFSTAGQYKILLYESNDSFTWRSLCYIKGNGSIQNKFALTSFGDFVTVVAKEDVNGGELKSWTFNAPSQNNIDIYSTGKVIDTGRAYIDNACSVAASQDGVLFAAWATKWTDSAYDFIDIRYSKSTDGGNSWQNSMSLGYDDGSNYQNPCVVVLNDNTPFVVYQKNKNNSLYNIIGTNIYFDDGTYASARNVFIAHSTGVAYPCESPCAVVDSTGIVHVAWQGKDNASGNAYNIMYNKSNANYDIDSWSSSPVKLTSETQYNQIQPTITSDLNNKVYVLWTGIVDSISTTQYQLRKIAVTNRLPSGISNLSSYTGGSIKGPAVLANYTGFVDPICMYQDTVSSNVPFRGQYTESNYFVKDLLQPNTQYKTKMEVWDKYSRCTSVVQDVYTKAQVPSISIPNESNNSADIAATDNNPVYTQYQITDGDKYVSSTGELTSVPVWINLTNKKITVKGLSGGTVYNFQAKARNQEGVETVLCNAVSIETRLDKPTGVVAVAGSNKIKVLWNPIVGAAKYEIQVDSALTLITVPNAVSYIHQGLIQNTSHTYKIRGVSASGKLGDWSDLITKKSITPEQMTCTVNYPQDKLFNITLRATYVEDFDVVKFSVMYNPGDMEVVDLCATTLRNDLFAGDIPNSSISVSSFTPGVITFEVTKPYVQGKSWFGVINRVKFKSKINGQSIITYKVE